MTRYGIIDLDQYLIQKDTKPLEVHDPMLTDCQSDPWETPQCIFSCNDHHGTQFVHKLVCLAQGESYNSETDKCVFYGL